MRFTFKTEKPTGPYSSFDSDRNVIKYQKKEVGLIYQSDNGFKVQLAVVKKDLNADKNPNSPWRWAFFKKEFTSLQEAKEWLNSNIEGLMSKFELYLFND